MGDPPSTNSDNELLASYLSCHDSEAIAQLVHRHGRMVLGVCHRVLGNQADAEDAFQATFLVLVQRARSIRKGQSVGPWLHKVAFRTAMRARNMRKTMESVDGDDLVDGRGLPDVALAEIVDEALNALPESERGLIVLCDLEGYKHREAAAELGVPVSTVSNRLVRAREKLRQELQRRGIVIGLTALSGALGQLAFSSPVSAELAQTTLNVVGHASEVGLAAQGVASANAVGLAKTVLIRLAVAKGTAMLVLAAVLWAGSLDGPPQRRKAAQPTGPLVHESVVILTEGHRGPGLVQISDLQGRAHAFHRAQPVILPVRAGSSAIRPQPVQLLQ